MALNVRPVGDRILVEAVEEKENKGKKGGIIIPDTAKEKPMESVLVNKYGGTEIKLDGKEYKILNSDDILAVIE
jgi:chaperonin GroES